jgi:archaellum biogenesis ATPase FlaH
MFVDDDGKKEGYTNVGFKKGKQNCLVCGRTEDWKCRVREDEKLGLCSYESSEKQDSKGRYIHYLPGNDADVMSVDFIAESDGSADAGIVRADAEVLHAAYSAFLAQLNLDETHKRSLLNRGLSEAAIEASGYKSVPHYERRYEVTEPLSAFLGMCGIPGFFQDEGRWSLNTVFPGFYIPYRDANGNITGLQIRKDDETVSKYIWLSSFGKPSGISSGVPIHFVNPEIIKETGTVYITEGGLKADVIGEKEGVGLIASAGVSAVNPDEVEKVIYEAFPTVRRIVAAYDMDWLENAQVRNALIRLVSHLNKQDVQVEIYWWETDFGKGWDDVAAHERRHEATFGTMTVDEFLDPSPSTWDDELELIRKIKADQNPLAYSWGQFQNLSLSSVDHVVFGIPRGSVGLLVASTNLGKSTLSMNLALSAASGRSYEPLLSAAHSAKRVLYIDGESTRVELQADISLMTKALLEPEKALVQENLFLICDEELDGESLDLANAQHRRAIETIASDCKPDLIVVDTLSALMTIEDENDNAQVKKEVMLPLRELARRSNAGVLLLHHTGKYIEGSTAAGAYRGRGASALGALSRSVFSLEKDNTGDNRVALLCHKTKGVPFAKTFLELQRDDRWFEICQVAAKDQTLYEKVIDYVCGLERVVKREEIRESLGMADATLGRCLLTAEERGDLKKVRHGNYACPNAQLNGQESSVDE